jgi:hypothetical protein
MRVQLQAVSLRMQALRSNEQMAVAMRGATKVRFANVLRYRCLLMYVKRIGDGSDEPLLEPSAGMYTFHLPAI